VRKGRHSSQVSRQVSDSSVIAPVAALLRSSLSLIGPTGTPLMPTNQPSAAGSSGAAAAARLAAAIAAAIVFGWTIAVVSSSSGSAGAVIASAQEPRLASTELEAGGSEVVEITSPSDAPGSDS
jgi:hypothetical protein